MNYDDDCSDEEIYQCTVSAKHRFVSRIDEIYDKYKNDTRRNVEVMDVRTFKVLTDEGKDGNLTTWCDDDSHCSDSDEDYVDSSYNDGRCSSSLASSNRSKNDDDGSPTSAKQNETDVLPNSNYLRRIQSRRTEEKGQGSIVKIENPDIFIDVLQSAKFQVSQMYKTIEKIEPFNESPSSEDEFLYSSENFKKKCKHGVKIPRTSSKNKLNKKKNEDLEKNYDAIPDCNLGFLSRKNQRSDKTNYDINFLEEIPHNNHVKSERALAANKSFVRNKPLGSAASSCSSCSFDTDSLDSPKRRFLSFHSSQKKFSSLK